MRLPPARLRSKAVPSGSVRPLLASDVQYELPTLKHKKATVDHPSIKPCPPPAAPSISRDPAAHIYIHCRAPPVRRAALALSRTDPPRLRVRRFVAPHSAGPTPRYVSPSDTRGLPRALDVRSPPPAAPPPWRRCSRPRSLVTFWLARGAHNEDVHQARRLRRARRRRPQREKMPELRPGALKTPPKKCASLGMSWPSPPAGEVLPLWLLLADFLSYFLSFFPSFLLPPSCIPSPLLSIPHRHLWVHTRTATPAPPNNSADSIFRLGSPMSGIHSTHARYCRPPSTLAIFLGFPCTTLLVAPQPLHLDSGPVLTPRELCNGAMLKSTAATGLYLRVTARR
ncbi:hypothetical protein C8J57DRAFT_1614199 [Mycena rebaudengoi]|nr:hypothetical protein C8J57DRAFT_1614199 [Mycena rebaudengoi]